MDTTDLSWAKTSKNSSDEEKFWNSAVNKGVDNFLFKLTTHSPKIKCTEGHWMGKLFPWSQNSSSVTPQTAEMLLTTRLPDLLGTTEQQKLYRIYSFAVKVFIYTTKTP